MTMMDTPISIITDILTKTERKKLIKDCQPFLQNVGEGYPALQTKCVLISHSQFYNPIIKVASRAQEAIGKSLSVERAWINKDDGRKEDILWHCHEGYDYSLVYYMQTLPFINSGTLFKHKFVRVPQNGAMIFPSLIQHTVPSYPFSWFKRYSMAIDFIVI